MAASGASVAPSLAGVDGLLVALPSGRALGCCGGAHAAAEDPALAVYLPAGREDVRQRLLAAHVAQARGEDAVRSPPERATAACRCSSARGGAQGRSAPLRVR